MLLLFFFSPRSTSEGLRLEQGREGPEPLSPGAGRPSPASQVNSAGVSREGWLRGSASTHTLLPPLLPTGTSNCKYIKRCEAREGKQRISRSLPPSPFPGSLSTRRRKQATPHPARKMKQKAREDKKQGEIQLRTRCKETSAAFPPFAVARSAFAGGGVGCVQQNPPSAF